MSNHHQPAYRKIVSREQAVGIRNEAKGAGKRVGFTSGAFDILHSGHVEYLERARQLCELLIVGVNSDSSIQRYKDPLRPVISQAARVAVVAGLAAVDAVFIFDEENNNANIEALRPDLYIKAGDYKREKLTSAPLVEKYGGKVEIVPFKEGFSTSAVITSIVDRFGATYTALPALDQKPALFVDRDGTIIEHVEYIHEPSKVRPLPGAFEALVALRARGFRIVITTNQPGIGLGYFTKEDFFATNREFLKQLSAAGGKVDKVYFCPHTEAEGCGCRKPKTGMIERAARELTLDLTKSWVIGDMTLDIQLGKNAGLKTVLVKTGYGGSDKRFAGVPDRICTDLAEVVTFLGVE